MASPSTAPGGRILSEPGQQQVRLAAGVLDTAVGALGLAVLGLQLGAADHVHVLGWMIGA